MLGRLLALGHRVPLRLGRGAPSEDCEVRGNVVVNGELNIVKFKDVIQADFQAQTLDNKPVKGEGELDTARYGSVLRARRPVGVRGCGLSYDGNYYVRGVTHTIARGAYTQNFTLGREGTGALLPVVRP